MVASATGSGVSYACDENGRLLATTDRGGDTATYRYDGVGNLLNIGRQPSSTLSVIHLSPSTGLAGDAVTISGTGFAAAAGSPRPT